MNRATIIETERLFLSNFHAEDAEAFYRLNLDEDVMRYTGDRPFASIAESRSFIKNYNHYARYGYGRWTVILKSNNMTVGWCGLKNHPEEGYVDLGYRLLKSHWGKGIATEAAMACVDYGFGVIDLKSLVGRTAEENLGSIRVLEKIGMQFWKNAPCEGIEHSVYYKLNKEDWIRDRSVDGRS